MSVQNTVGHGDWGMYAALLSFSFLFITLADLGVNQYLTKTLASEPHRMQQLYPNFFGLKLVLMAAYPAVMLLAGWVMGYTLQELFFLVLLSLVWGAHQITQFFRANFQAMQRFRIDSVASVLDRVVLLAIVGVLFLTQLNIERFIYARLLAAVVTALFFFVILSRLYHWLMPRLELNFLRQALQLSLPFALLTILNSVHDKVDQVMLERLSGELETGLYAAAYRWMDVFNMYLWTVLTIFFARFALHLSNFKEQEKLLAFGQVICALPMLFVCVFVFFYGDQLLWLYTNSSAEELATMSKSLKILFVATFIHSLWVIYGTMLSVTNHERFINFAIVGGVIINITLNFLLIPRFGALAAAGSTVASYGLMSLAFVIYVERVVPVKVPYGKMGRLLLITVALGLIFFLLEQIGWPWYVNTLIAAVLYGGLSLTFNLVPLGELRKLLKLGGRENEEN